MARNRTILAVLGASAAAVGAVTVAAPDLAPALAVPRVPVAIVGGLAGVFALFVGLRRRASTVTAADPRHVEAAVDHPIPGTDFDANLEGSGRVGLHAARTRSESRARLEDVAVETLVATEGWTTEAAEAALADGTWTTDPLAAACFTGQPVEVSTRAMLTQYLDGRSRTQREFDHAVLALQARLAGEDQP